MRVSLRVRMMILLFAFAIVLNIVSIFMNYRNFVNSSEQFTYSMASTVAETCSLIIDTDSLKHYIDTNRRDSAYYETWNKLIDYKNTNSDIISLSVVWFDNNGCHYIMDTDLTEAGAHLGDYRDFDDKQEDYAGDLMAGNSIEFLRYGTHMDIYRPVLSSYNIALGYVIVGVSTTAAKQEQFQYLLRLVAVVFTLTFIIVIIFLWEISRTIIRPINRLSKAAVNYGKSIEEGNEQSALQKLTIRTGDEIEHLFESLKKMERDLLNSSNSLAVATWNSNHDSMTQLYNKRYLWDDAQKTVNRKPVAAFYFDVDNLKKMNDICGHEHGDDVICRTAEFIKKYVPENGFAFRIGGDEFLMLVYDCTAEEAKTLFKQIQFDPEKQLTPPESKVACRIAAGCVHTADCDNLEALVEAADKRMYLDKHSHR